jgi:cardiolipin synthase
VRSQALVTSPPEGRFEARKAIIEAIDGARRTIDIEQQYLWDEDLCERLLAAAKRGVAIRVILPGASDKAFKYLNRQSLNALLKAGGQARLYRGEPADAHVHTKYFAMDDQLAFIGSINGDTRALLDNQELDVAIADAELTQALKTRLFEHDWAHASIVYSLEDEPWFVTSFTKLWEIFAYYS